MTNNSISQPPSEYKTIIVKKRYLDFKNFFGVIFFLWLGGGITYASIQQVIGGSWGYLLLVLLGVIAILIGVGCMMVLFSKRDQEVSVRKSDNEILDELIAHEEAIERISKAKVVKQAPEVIKAVLKSKDHSLDMSQKNSEVINNLISNLDNTKGIIDLVLDKSINSIFYGDLLFCHEWRHQRFRVLLRDNFTCQRCNKKSAHNHVHHTIYIQDKFPWEINDSYLKSLCPMCHRTVHETTNIPIKTIQIDGSLRTIKDVHFDCNRCGGTGYLSEFSHNQGGICFKCMGGESRNTTFRTALLNFRQNKHDYSDKDQRIKYREFLLKLTQRDIDKLPAVYLNGMSKIFNII